MIATVDGDPARARKALATVDGVGSVDVFGDELRVAAEQGARSLSPIALALDAAGVTVRELSLRTPTLDDVFLDVTGTHLEGGVA